MLMLALEVAGILVVGYVALCIFVACLKAFLAGLTHKSPEAWQRSLDEMYEARGMKPPKKR